VSIGEVLAEARCRAGLSVAQVSQRTCIRETIITGIEGDDYSACGGDFYARGHIRSIAGVTGADPEPLIGEYDAARLGAEASRDVTEPVPRIRMRQRRQLSWAAAAGMALVVAAALGVAAYYLLAGSGPAAPARAGAAARTAAAAAARAHPVTRRPAARHQPAAAAPKTASPAVVAARTLIPVSAAAFDPYGTEPAGSVQADLAIDGSPGTAWHTDWYTTAHFGNLYPGTGLLVDMGRPVTITAARLSLGTARGASLQLRVGAAPALADLKPVARAASASGTVNLRLAAPARGRYVLIWFTSLPPDPAGTFQASVYDLRLKGRA
jgi:hypothetical protein